MDFMWFWVAVAISVEVVRQTHQHCFPKKKSGNKDEGWREPLLRDGKCPYACCTQEIENYESETAVDTDESSDEIVSNEISSEEIFSDEIVSDEIVSSEDLEEYTNGLIDKGKGKNLVRDDGMQEIIGRVYQGGSGHPTLVHFKVSDNYFKMAENGVAQAMRKEVSAKVHPQLNGLAANQIHSSVGTSSRKDNSSTEPRVLPPIQEVMVANHANIRGGS